jgi:hypothetical protein
LSRFWRLKWTIALDVAVAFICARSSLRNCSAPTNQPRWSVENSSSSSLPRRHSMRAQTPYGRRGYPSECRGGEFSGGGREKDIVLAPLRGAWESASGIRGGAGPVSATPWLPAVTPFGVWEKRQRRLGLRLRRESAWVGFGGGGYPSSGG